MQIVLAARTQFHCTWPPQCRKGREWVWLEGEFVQRDREYRGPAAGHNLHELVDAGDQICVLKVVHVHPFCTISFTHLVSCTAWKIIFSAARHFQVLRGSENACLFCTTCISWVIVLPICKAQDKLHTTNTSLLQVSLCRCRSWPYCSLKVKHGSGCPLSTDAWKEGELAAGCPECGLKEQP